MWFPAFLRRRRDHSVPRPPDALFSWGAGRSPWLPGGTYVGTTGFIGRVTRDEALSVPAVLRGRNLICSLAALPLQVLDKQLQASVPTLFAQIDRNVPNVVTVAQTLEDLIFESASWWQITDFAFDGFPAHARHVDFEAVSLNPPPGFSIHSLPSGLHPDGVVFVMGEPVDVRQMIRFDSPNTPLLQHGARAIRRALKLARASEMYSDDPEARAVWMPKGDTDPGDSETIQGYLRDYAAARRAGSEAYIPAALDRKTPQGTSPVDLQLAQLQQRSDLEIANIMGLDPEDIGVNTTSRTYANAVDRRVDQVNQTLAPFMRALTDRLSMGDVTKRGYRVELDLTEYLKADPATRWANYGIALDKGVLSVPEVRAREKYPEVPVGRSAPVPSQGAPVQQQNTRRQIVQHFIGEQGPDDRQQFAFPTEALALSVDASKRTITGEVLPYNVIGENYAGKWKFSPGSLEWNRSAVSRVKLNDEHYGAAFGSATVLKDTPTAMTGTFKVGRGAVGDAQLMSAEDGIKDGLSAEVRILEYTVDRSGDSPVNIVTKARLTGVALTSSPAFDDARVTKVAASATSGGTVPEQAPTAPEQTPGITEAVTALTSATTAFSEAVAALNGAVPDEQRAVVIPRAVSVREPMVYSMNGTGDSFCRDAWLSKKGSYGSKDVADALARLEKYQRQTEDHAVAFANAGNTTDQAQIIAPGYRPDLYVAQIPGGRPLFDSIGTRVMLRDATAFKVPVWVGSAGLNGTNSEGTGPSTGTITDHTYLTVTPTAQTGEFEITRELVDSSNPAIDTIAMNAMREEYNSDTEAIIAAAIAAATDDGSPVDGTPDQSTEGCWVYTLTGTGNDLAVNGIRDMEADYVGHRHLVPDRMLASPTGFKALSKTTDDIGRPLFAYVGPANSVGTVGRAGQSLNVDGLLVPNAWTMTSTYDDLLLFNSIDLLVGESPMLRFRFEEKSGPEKIVLNTWAYFCFQILRYAGVHSMNYTASD